MMFWFWIVIAAMVGCALGVGYLAMVSNSGSSNEINVELYQALEEWVEINENYWNAPDFGKKRYERSCKALNRARGM